MSSSILCFLCRGCRTTNVSEPTNTPPINETRLSESQIDVSVTEIGKNEIIYNKDIDIENVKEVECIKTDTSTFVEESKPEPALPVVVEEPAVIEEPVVTEDALAVDYTKELAELDTTEHKSLDI